MIVCNSSNLNNNNIDKATPTNYQLVFPKIPTESSITANNPFVMNIHSAVIPSLSIAVNEMFWQGNKVRYDLNPMEFDPWLVSFVVDSRIMNWSLLFKWMSFINNNWNKIAEYKKEYAVDVSMIITDNYGNSVMELIFVDIWPSTLGEISFSQREGDVILESTINFNYDYFYVRSTSWTQEFSSSSSSQSNSSSSSSSFSSSSSSSSLSSSSSSNSSSSSSSSSSLSSVSSSSSSSSTMPFPVSAASEPTVFDCSVETFPNELWSLNVTQGQSRFETVCGSNYVRWYAVDNYNDPKDEAILYSNWKLYGDFQITAWVTITTDDYPLTDTQWNMAVVLFDENVGITTTRDDWLAYAIKTRATNGFRYRGWGGRDVTNVAVFGGYSNVAMQFTRTNGTINVSTYMGFSTSLDVCFNFYDPVVFGYIANNEQNRIAHTYNYYNTGGVGLRINYADGISPIMIPYL